MMILCWKNRTGAMSGRKIAGTATIWERNMMLPQVKRIFLDKKRVVYTSNFNIDEASGNVWIDKTEKPFYIVNFL